MFNKLSKIAEAGVQIQEVSGISRSQMSSAPGSTKQKNWGYSVAENEKGEKFIRLSNNGKVMNFRVGGPGADNAFIDLERLSDLMPDAAEKDSVLSQGIFQVHKSSPFLIHGTVQDGKKGLSLEFAEKDGKWMMSPKAPKTRVNSAAKFVENVKKGTYLNDVKEQFMSPTTGLSGLAVGTGIGLSRALRDDSGATALERLANVLLMGAAGYGIGRVVEPVVNPLLDRAFAPDEEKEKKKVAAMSATDLLAQGSCCGNGCANCPYEPRHEGGSTKTAATLNLNQYEKGRDHLPFREKSEAFLLDKDKNVVVQIIPRNDGSGTSWPKLPGGGLDAGENFEDALRREVMEEIGADIDKVKYHGRVDRIWPKSFAESGDKARDRYNQFRGARIHLLSGIIKNMSKPTSLEGDAWKTIPLMPIGEASKKMQEMHDIEPDKEEKEVRALQLKALQSLAVNKVARFLKSAAEKLPASPTLAAARPAFGTDWTEDKFNPSLVDNPMEPYKAKFTDYLTGPSRRKVTAPDIYPADMIKPYYGNNLKTEMQKADDYNKSNNLPGNQNAWFRPVKLMNNSIEANFGGPHYSEPFMQDVSGRGGSVRAPLNPVPLNPLHRDFTPPSSARPVNRNGHLERSLASPASLPTIHMPSVDAETEIDRIYHKVKQPGNVRPHLGITASDLPSNNVDFRKDTLSHEIGHAGQMTPSVAGFDQMTMPTRLSLWNDENPSAPNRFDQHVKDYQRDLTSLHEEAPGEMRNYMGDIQRNLFKQTGKRIESPEQWGTYLQNLNYTDPNNEAFEKRMIDQNVPPDTRRMFRRMRHLNTTQPDRHRKIIDWQKSVIPGLVQNGANGSGQKAAARLSEHLKTAGLRPIHERMCRLAERRSDTPDKWLADRGMNSDGTEKQAAQEFEEIKIILGEGGNKVEMPNPPSAPTPPPKAPIPPPKAPETPKIPTQKSGKFSIQKVRNFLKGKIVSAGKSVNTEPSKAQRDSGNYAKGHVWIQGLDITIENPKGSVRSGVTKDGTKWETTMKNCYGYIRNYARSEADSDHVDVFLGEHPESEIVFVIDQYIDGKFDEHKCVIGATSTKEANAIYDSNYQKGWQGRWNTTALTMKQFKKWLISKKTAGPLAGKNLIEFIKKASGENSSFADNSTETSMLHETIAAWKTAAEDKKKKEKGRLLLPASIAATGLGAGAVTLANKSFSPQDEAYLSHTKAFVEKVNNAPTPAEKIDNYVNILGEASRSSLFGMPAWKVMKFIRQLPGIPEKWQWKGDENSGRHYRVFEAGPVSAYREMVPEEAARRPEIIQRTGLTEPEFLNAFDNHVRQAGSMMNIKPDSSGNFSVDEQKKIFPLIRPFLQKNNPTLYQAIDEYEKTKMPKLEDYSKGYTGITNQVLKARDAVRWAGIATGALGLAGLGYWTARKIQEKRDSKKNKRQPVLLGSNRLGVELKLASGENPSFADKLLSPFTADNPIEGTLYGLAGGTAIGAGVGVIKKLKRKLFGEPDDDVSILGDAALGGAIGIGAGLLGGISGRNSFHSASPVFRRRYGDQWQEKSKELYPQHFEKNVVQPARQDAALAAQVAGVPGNIAGHLPQVLQEGDRQKQLSDSAIMGTVLTPPLLNLHQTSFGLYPWAKSGTDYYSIQQQIQNDPTLTPFRKEELLQQIQAAKSYGLGMDPKQLVAAGLGALAGWLMSKAVGAGSAGQMIGGIGGALFGGWAGSGHDETIYGDGYYRP